MSESLSLLNEWNYSSSLDPACACVCVCVCVCLGVCVCVCVCGGVYWAHRGALLPPLYTAKGRMQRYRDFLPLLSFLPSFLPFFLSFCLSFFQHFLLHCKNVLSSK